MENFSNETLNTFELPKFEAVVFSKIDKKYWKVVLLNTTLILIIVAIIEILLLIYVEESEPYRVAGGIAFFVAVIVVFLLKRIAFNKKAFAFREHDVLYKSGIIATNTTIIPYNRIQHVVKHEGVFSRYFKLATIEIFTAGENSGDIEIPGLPIDQAEVIKQYLSVKIQNQL